MGIRCNVTALTPMQRANYVSAVIALKKAGTYDWYVRTHLATTTRTPRQSHASPMFLPWHRQFLRQFEADLTAVTGTPVSIPYWDWAADAALRDPTRASVWGSDFMGGNGSPVTTGPFRKGPWTLAAGGSLVRQFGKTPGAPTLPTATDVSAALAVPVYDMTPWTAVGVAPPGYQSFRDQLEGFLNGPQLHNRVHLWVGGSMVPMSSPDDPVFFLHHANVDRLWSQWQVLHPTASYLPQTGVAGVGADDPMWPWDGTTEPATVTPDDVLSTAGLGYVYDSDFQRSELIGGPHGDPFDDSRAVATIPVRVVSLTVTWNSAITSIATTYGDGRKVTHGTPGTGDDSLSWTFDAGEQIRSVSALLDKQHDKTGVINLQLHTTAPRTLTAGPNRGSAGGGIVTVAPGTAFAGFLGRASDRIFSIGIVTVPA